MYRYILFYKPFEVLSQFTDTQGRMTLKSMVPFDGVYAAGRLDYRSEGLLLLTDHGLLILRLTDPKFNHRKTYLAQVEGLVDEQAMQRLRTEIVLSDQQRLPIAIRNIAAPDLAERSTPVRNYHPTSWLEITLVEGKKHQVRRMTAAVGFPTLRLVRSAIGDLHLRGLQPGDWRELSREEVQKLLKSVGLNHDSA
jgi:23S rRNA pseudouridine2457 synthase